ncbi:hypothetical protein EGW08_022661 [Elysia chlorotica]|uniref:LITAF domain-containing protein n=1 Tax=Elysia chlorotica TaxID=188477 RepID=A0A433SKB7_ELYCH|nr:hypothetical protein EGW08_022661 [Elysia chlorotica]
MADYGAVYTHPHEAQQQAPVYHSPLVIVIYGPESTTIRCQHCGEIVNTVTETKAGALTYLLSLMLFMWGCFAGCCCIPFCVNFGKNVEHSCPYCNNVVGTYKPI